MQQPPSQFGWYDEEYDKAVAEKKNRRQWYLRNFQNQTEETVKFDKKGRRQFERTYFEGLDEESKSVKEIFKATYK